MKLTDKQIEKLVKACEEVYSDSGWCPACDCHDHAEDCPVEVFRSEDAPTTQNLPRWCAAKGSCGNHNRGETPGACVESPGFWCDCVNLMRERLPAQTTQNTNGGGE